MLLFLPMDKRNINTRKGKTMKKKKKQKSQKMPKRKYDFQEAELWNADITMAEFNYQLLKKFKKMKRHTYPGEYCPEADTPEKWEKLINKFIKTFKRILNDFDDSPLNKALDKMYKEHPEYLGFKLIKQKDGTYIKNPEGNKIRKKYVTEKVKNKEKQYRERINKNLELFGKYFLQLWD